MHDAKRISGLVGFERAPTPPPASKLDIRAPTSIRVGRDDKSVFLVFDGGTPGAVAFVLSATAAATISVDLAQGAAEIADMAIAEGALHEGVEPRNGEAR